MRVGPGVHESTDVSDVDVSIGDRLEVRVNDELVLDAGACEEVSGPHGPERLIHPPESTLFHQVLAYLKAKPDPPQRPSGSMVDREGLAAAALTVRWGSYLAVLVDHDKPLWSETNSAGTSRISDGEMARINIEASAALAEWIDIHREDPGGQASPSNPARSTSRSRAARSAARDLRRITMTMPW